MVITLPTIACLLGVLASADALAACGSSPTIDTKCSVVTECRKAFDEFRKMHANNPYMADALLRITCGFENNVPKICCPLQSHHENLSITTNSQEPVAGAPAHCGTINFDRILTAQGTPTELEQYDWLALLEYKTPTSDNQVGCGGALISDRYVLTAAHCVEPWRQLTGVRLGEYDLRTGGDCIYEADQRYCNNKTTSFGVEEVISHEKYVYSDRAYPATDRLYDIALVRLNVSVASLFGNPICLPGEQQPTPAKSYTTAGWGVGPSVRPATQVKRFAQPKHLDRDACAKKLGRQAIERDVVCTSAQNDFLGCLADSGGPLMAFDKQARFTLVGISALATGATCSQTSDSINVYTDVNQYISWIYGRMR